ncbi:MAG TPA: tRNA 2-selenouridine(34) synthase MnmH [Pseudobdellovibrionaceae bacterium]|nr:tRNA 2-selenouridine(34) synthase MnmH [Pseudobdellovibrionaceae bacterium]
MNEVALKFLQRLARGEELLDVRAPIEFAAGHFPGTFNLPLLNNEERAAVGTAYKQEGADAALRLGQQLVAGEVRQSRVDAWINFLSDRPNAKICCFRGGLRSQLVQAELRKHGIDREIIPGGYKALRQASVDILAKFDLPIMVLGGLTGSGKTELLASQTHLDLEAAAEHRGSAFGARGLTSPHQAVFENRVALQILRASSHSNPIWIEDESRTIGRLVLPPHLFQRMQEAKLAVIEVPRTERAQRLTRQYLQEMFAAEDGARPNEARLREIQFSLNSKLQQLQKRLGGLETQRLSEQLAESIRGFALSGEFACFWTWVERLLEVYYDPMYLRHLDQNRDRIVFRGNHEEWKTWSRSPRV